ncbi:MAG: hypothetical protein OXJ52_00135 [Oligoflexia bacterium]|nr:hypothetical protein [Oligoflexia bacterium]
MFFPLTLQAEDNSEKKSGYRYIVENYFSKRANSRSYYDYSRAFTLSSGISIYRASKDKTFKSFSSFNLSFTQNVREIDFFGDLNLKFSIFNSQMSRQKATLLEVTPFISVPEIQTAFPFYVGMGFGFGFYPRYLIQQLPAFSVNAQLFFGFRFLEVYHNLGFFTELNLRIHYPFSELTAYLETLTQFGFIFRF